ncbi:MAG: hypothetical protein JXX28_18090 [Deltaproteobacteria bacterium]|nr:hypothetical protein [Deltaproteobacteria bacterium]
MTPQDLTQEEHLALVGLLRQLAAMDGTVTEAETAALQELGDELGGNRFLQRWREAGERFSTPQDALDFAAHEVQRPEARRLILTLLVDLVQVERRSRAEEQLVGKVRLMWGLF